jgi:hypothetical protein
MSGTLVFTNPKITWNGQDISAKTRTASLSYESEVQDATAFTDATRIRLGGLKVWSLDAEFFTDESTAANGVNKLLFPDVGVTRTLLIQPTTSAVSTTNPSYSGTALLSQFSPLGGTVGDMSIGNASFQSSGTLTRSTT